MQSRNREIEFEKSKSLLVWGDSKEVGVCNGADEHKTDDLRFKVDRLLLPVY